MISVRFIAADGAEFAVDAATDHSLMSAAVNHRVPGILAECGGMCACATCHVYVPPEWIERLPSPDGMEAGMLTGAIEPKPESRLACQIILTPDMDGLTVRLPVNQI